MGEVFGVIKFEWDEGNLSKNWTKHNVDSFESEEIFFNKPLITLRDEKHSKIESRYIALGRTNSGGLLLVVFTIRGEVIRVISAKDMHKKERTVYNEEKTKKDS